MLAKNDERDERPRGTLSITEENDLNRFINDYKWKKWCVVYPFPNTRTITRYTAGGKQETRSILSSSVDYIPIRFLFLVKLLVSSSANYCNYYYYYCYYDNYYYYHSLLLLMLLRTYVNLSIELSSSFTLGRAMLRHFEISVQFRVQITRWEEKLRLL